MKRNHKKRFLSDLKAHIVFCREQEPTAENHRHVSYWEYVLDYATRNMPGDWSDQQVESYKERVGFY
jgi:hypothetical protein